MIAIQHVVLSFLVLTCLSFVALSWKRTASRPAIRMSAENCNNEVSIADFSKSNMNGVMKVTASAMSAFSLATVANAYGEG
jgi:hypothetical protein